MLASSQFHIQDTIEISAEMSEYRESSAKGGIFALRAPADLVHVFMEF